VDVGASLLEDPTYQSLVDDGIAHVIGFEPDTKEVEKLRETYASTHSFYPYFIGDGKDGTFHETSWVATGSLYPPKPSVLDKFHILGEVTALVAKHPVQTKALDDIEEIKDVDYIKIDIQGAELQAFAGGERALAEAMVIHTEVEFIEMYEGQPMFSDVDLYLRARGFHFVKYFPAFTPTLKPTLVGGSPHKGNIWVGADALYVRDWNKLELISTAKMKRLAVIAHDIYEMMDLVYFLLLEIDRREGSELSGEYLGKFQQ
jgi:FkbM family methyltransferase